MLIAILGEIIFTPCPYWIRFWQLNFYQKILEVKIDVNRVNLTRSFPLIESLKNEHFLAFIAHANEG